MRSTRFMMTFAATSKNNIRRLAEHKPKFLLYLFLTAGALAASIFINAMPTTAGNVAVISAAGMDAAAAADYVNATQLDSEYVNATQLGREPAMSELVSGKYDAIVAFDEQGGYEIKTIKGDEYERTLFAAMFEPAAYSADQAGARGPGANIIGFMMMFILMQGSSLMFMFAEDKERKQIQRVAASPVSFTGYLSAHGFFVFAILLAPAMAMLAIARYILGIDIGLGLLGYLGLASMLCALSASYALFLVAVIKKGDSANMVGSASTILTSVLSGSFYSFEKGNRALEAMIKVLPQKAFLSMAELMEQGKSMSGWYHHGLYVAALIALFLVIGTAKTKMDYARR